MVRTSVYFRPDARDADLVRVGTLYLSRTTDRTMVYTSFMSDIAVLPRVEDLTTSEAMRGMLADLGAVFHRAVPGTDFATADCEELIVEYIFRLLPTNLRHDAVEQYPAEDFFVRVVSEREEERAKKLDRSNVVTAAGPLTAC